MSAVGRKLPLPKKLNSIILLGHANANEWGNSPRLCTSRTLLIFNAIAMSALLLGERYAVFPNTTINNVFATILFIGICIELFRYGNRYGAAASVRVAFAISLALITMQSIVMFMSSVSYAPVIALGYILFTLFFSYIFGAVYGPSATKERAARPQKEIESSGIVKSLRTVLDSKNF